MSQSKSKVVPRCFRLPILDFGFDLHFICSRHKAIMNPHGILVVFGTLNRLDAYDDDYKRHVDRVELHPKYRRYINYDVAILYLKERMPENIRYAKPIAKRRRLRIVEGMSCITMGWGQVYPVVANTIHSSIARNHIFIIAWPICQSIDVFGCHRS